MSEAALAGEPREPRKGSRAQPRARNASRSCRVSTPTGLPSSCTSTASAVSSSATAARAASVEPIVGSGGGHVVLDRVGELGGAGEQRVQQGPLGDRARRPRPPRSAAPRGPRASGRRRTPGGCATASAMVSAGCVCTRSGSRPSLPRSTSPTVGTSRVGVADREAVRRQPLVVEDLGEVAAAGVGQQHHDHGVLALGGAGELLRRAASRRTPPCRTSRRPAAPPRGPAAG